MDDQSLVSGPVHWHEHAAPYAAIVIGGGYSERGDGGLAIAEEGDVLIHRPFEIHSNAIGRKGARVLNVPLAIAEAFRLTSGCLPDAGRVIRELQRGLPAFEALALIRPAARAYLSEEADELADALRINGSVPLAQMAEDLQLPGRSLRRDFRKLYGMSAARYRARARARRAWREIMTTNQPLALIAADFGFADQAHMTREVTQLTRRPPAAWRRFGR